MEGFREMEMLVIEVVADFVHERSQEGAELDYLNTLRSAHPDADARPPARDLVGLVESLQLAAGIRGPSLEHAYQHRGHGELAIDRIDQRLARAFDMGALGRGERRLGRRR